MSLKDRPRGIRRIWRDRSGASALEFAIVAPIFIVMVLGMIQVSLVLFTYHALENALSSGARYLYFNIEDENGAKDAIRQSAGENFLDARLLTITSERLGVPYPHIKLTAVYAFTGIGLSIPTVSMDLRSSVTVATTAD